MVSCVDGFILHVSSNVVDILLKSMVRAHWLNKRSLFFNFYSIISTLINADS